ncbi:hypothetical protein BpHYR1_036019 [Brachionus plicatilis]|uniref:Uncharacterized protein n=1 Tax=Brachionus plicatilis TaxID=10195 RepID=A0A3M7SXL8_BRAPC|nr:hypothetical protein BpHYR1_036019 [Brachionus plicatilis]
MVIHFCSNQWTLWKVEPIEFVIGSVLNRVAWCAHCLLAHLALIHVTGRLTKLFATVGNRGGGDAIN